jgi:hypothetical protein
MRRATFVRVGRGGMTVCLPPRRHPVRRWRARQQTKITARALFEGFQKERDVARLGGFTITGSWKDEP